MINFAGSEQRQQGDEEEEEEGAEEGGGEKEMSNTIGSASSDLIMSTQPFSEPSPEVEVEVEEILGAKRSRCSDHEMCDQYMWKAQLIPRLTILEISKGRMRWRGVAWRGVAAGIDGQQSQRGFA